MRFDWIIIILLLAALTPLFGLLLAVIWERRHREKTEKPPQTEKLLRPPGYSLSLRLEKVFDHLMDKLFISCIYSLIAGFWVVVLSFSFFLHAPFLWREICVSIFVVFVVASAMAALKAFHCFKELRNIRLGISGEQAVAEALNEVADIGFRAFHDLTEENWNIDHVAVGERGVFLIETKARRRRGSRNGLQEHKVIFDGESLQFPSYKYKDAEPIKQAKRNAIWLANYLYKKTGESVRVEALVILPGWFVRNSEKGNFPVQVMNAKYLIQFLRGQDSKIESAQVRRIITALDEKCRDVEF
ncbi:MAG TPA: nuclease-related domain-containing protein [Phycisphaerae bacterium]|nr:nuclease-related domain-containing protein [Phycisphaerae bacterium]